MMKKKIRRKITEERNSLDEETWMNASRKIQEKLILSDFYRRSESLLIYAHFDREVQTDIVITDALATGKVVCIPFNDMKEKTFMPSVISSCRDIDRSGKVPEPFVFRPYTGAGIDLAVIPGVAFDADGNRLGTGSGFFDRFLNHAKNGIIRVAVAFDFQVLEERIPCDPWDEKVDIIITEKRTLTVNKR